MFVKLMQDYRLRELFKPSMAELGLCMYQFECMIQVDALWWLMRLLCGVMMVLQRGGDNMELIYLFLCLAGTASRAAHAFPGSELSHLHVRLLLVPHHLPHLLPSVRRHKDLRHLHV